MTAFVPGGRRLPWTNAPPGRVFYIILTTYFAVQLVSRVCLSSSTHLDESEQMMLSQFWSWGYGPQPPLYTWLQIPFFTVFGTSVFALALLKNLLLFGTFALAYENGRRLTGESAGGLVAAVSLLFLPQVAWESQRDLTHSVLAAFISLVTLLIFLRMLEVPSWTIYAAFGACVGLGCLAKYNYVFFPFGLLVTAVLSRRWRDRVLTRKMVAAAIVAATLFLPTLVWISHHTEVTLLSSGKLRLAAADGRFLSALRGLKELGVSIVAFLSPMVGMLLVVFLWGGSRRANRNSPPASAVRREEALEGPLNVVPGELSRDECFGLSLLLLKALVSVMAMLAVLVVAFQVTGVRGRWLQPVLIAAPVVAAGLLKQRLRPRRVKILAGLGAGIAVLVAVMLPGRIVLGERLGRDEPLMRPYDVLARVVSARLEPGDVLVADTGVLAGNLRLNLPHHVAVTPEAARLFVPTPGSILLVWDATRSPAIPAALVDFIHGLGAAPPDQRATEFASATFKYHHRRQARIGMLRVKVIGRGMDQPPSFNGLHQETPENRAKSASVE